MVTPATNQDQDLDLLEIQDQEELQDDQVAAPVDDAAAPAVVAPTEEDEEAKLVEALDEVEVPVPTDDLAPEEVIVGTKKKVAPTDNDPTNGKPKPNMVSEELIHRPLELDELMDDGAL